MPTNEEWSDAEATADDAAGKPLYRSPEEGVAGMIKRIEILTQRFTDTTSETEAKQLGLEIAQSHARLPNIKPNSKARTD